MRSDVHKEQLSIDNCQIGLKLLIAVILLDMLKKHKYS